MYIYTYFLDSTFNKRSLADGQGQYCEWFGTAMRHQKRVARFTFPRHCFRQDIEDWQVHYTRRSITGGFIRAEFLSSGVREKIKAGCMAVQVACGWAGGSNVKAAPKRR